jgi:single-stranded-DNA-specific exonuclease
MGDMEQKLMLFESMLDYRGLEQIPSTKRGCKGQYETRVEQACRNCTNIKNKQTKARDASLNTIEQKIEDERLLENKILVIKLEPELATNKNLTGLIANVLMAKYQRPVLLLSRCERDGKVTWEGSGRGYDKSKFNDLRKFLKDSGLVSLAEGHPNALGVGIEDEKIDEFIEYSNCALQDFDFSPCYKVDFIFSASDLRNADIIGIADLKSIWGQGLEEPLVAIEHINVTKEKVQLMSRDKSPTLKITLPNGMSLIKFGSSEAEYESLCSESGCVTINVVGTCGKNEWNGAITPQIMIEDYEIVSTSKYYF